MQLRIEHHVAARDRILADAVAGEIERAALAGRAALGRAVLRVDRAHARRKPGRADRHAVADRDRAGQHGAGHDRAGAGKRERAIDREAEAAVAPRALPMLARGREQALAQRVDALAGDGRDRQDLGAGEAGAGAARARSRPRPRRAASGVDEIGLGQRDDAALDAEQVDDREMLARLRHDAVVGGDHQQHEIDAGRAGQHVVHELLVPRHVDEAEHRAVRRRQVGEAEIDRDAARLLLLQAVGIDAGERAHQRGLAVVDVAGGADDHGMAPPRSSAGKVRQRSRRSSSRQRRSSTSA